MRSARSLTVAALARVLALGLVFLAASICAAFSATEGRRVALVIGNGAYEHAPQLPNPPKDARDIAAKLKELGFDVVLGTDLTMTRFGETLREFSRHIEGADVGLMFYAGHGLQVDGTNYLVPVDAQLEAASDLEFQAVKLDTLLNVLEQSSKVSIVFLDACRNNPLSRSLTRDVNPPAGLAPQNIASGSYIAFATAPGNVAYDGQNAGNSPFTAALLNNIGRENVDIRLMMADVREDVFDATGKKQLPWENNSLIGRFYFREGATPQTLDEVNAKALAERDAFDRARAAGTADALEEFLAKYPDGLFAGIARDTLATLGKGKDETQTAATIDDIFWQTVRDSVLPDDFQLYLDTFDDGAYRDLAQARIDALRQAAAIQGYVMEDGQTLNSKESIRQAALRKIGDLPVMFVQYGLNALGFPIADPNGIMDSATRRAVRGYQASVGADQTGELTPRQTLDVVLAAAAVGDEHAETAVGVMMASGIGLDRNDQVARMWLTRAADRGNKYAQANLAILYRDGRGGGRDVEKARSLLKSAVAQGLGDAEPLLRDLGG
jgi:uncharacterized caspase-like protein